ncbi:MAG: oligosaccharide flippase family protein [Candidatus Roizmanbacteria bacterium]|nr:oligosaccharide flippase family protein [Candidatus Roizmanbacteria bacterium]
MREENGSKEIENMIVKNKDLTPDRFQTLKKSFLSVTSAIGPAFKRLPSSEFVCNIMVLSSGQGIAAAISLLAAPILGRLYLPAEYGALAIYMSIASVLAGIGNWQYAQGIIVESRDNKAEVLLRLCLVTTAITVAVATILAAGIMLYPNTSHAWQQVRIWFVMLPISTLLGGVVTAWSAMANRKKMYRAMAAIQVASVSLTVAISIAMGVMEYGHVGLMVSYFLGQITTFFAYGYLMYKRRQKKQDIGKSQLLAMGRKHKGFALFTTPSAFVNIFAMQFPIYVLGLLGAVDVVGFFCRARQLMTMPLTLLGGSIAQVFQQRAAADYAREGTCRSLYKKTFLMLSGVGLVPVVLLTIWAPDIFELILGSNWRDAGDIARILAPMLLLRLICNPLSTVFFITNSQRESLFLTISTAFLIITISLCSYLLDYGTLGIIVSFSIAYSIAYIVFLVRSYQLSLAHG